ncbi:hypothetical protein [Pontiella agarivorans]|uniref:Uncharacterized protein n=1 Tax=Pontiella agarivorans TaxID=3038953 RepID=A0ABU5MXU2_9BACT|nr:hypothetical protein [Pontiella agarivorans]MDZ8119019.1 hypothetical protein [Pontiella agarivorans]
MKMFGIGSSPISSGNLILIFSAIIGTVISNSRTTLKSHRPEIAEEVVVEPSGNQVDARLWEDPFDVLERWGKRYPETNARAELRSLKEILETRVDKLIVPVMTDDGHYPEMRENRIQQRYAVLAALSTSNYKPNSPQKMNIGRLVIGGVTNTVPYEWFSRDKSKPEVYPAGGLNGLAPAYEQPDNLYGNEFEHVCILWLRSDFLGTAAKAIVSPGQGPLSDYRKLSEALAPAAERGKRGVCDIRIIGPRSSEGIRRILQEIEAFRASGVWLEESIQILKKQLRELAAGQQDETVAGVDFKRQGNNGGTEQEYRAAVTGLSKEIWKYMQPGCNARLFSSLPFGGKEIGTKESAGIVINISLYGEELVRAEKLRIYRGTLTAIAEEEQKLRAALFKLENKLCELEQQREDAASGEQINSSPVHILSNEFNLVQTRQKLELLGQLREQLIRRAGGKENRFSRGNDPEPQQFHHDYLQQGSAADDYQRFEALLNLCTDEIDRLPFYRSKRKARIALEEVRSGFVKAAKDWAEREAEIKIEAAFTKIREMQTNRRASVNASMKHRISRLETAHIAVGRVVKNEQAEAGAMNGIKSLYATPVCSVFSPWATADNYLLNADLSNGRKFNELLNKKYDSGTTSGRDALAELRKEILYLHGIHFNRTVQKDKRVAKALVDELSRRGAILPPGNPRETPARIVLIGEWDSVFSRALSTTFALEYLQRQGRSALQWPEEIEVFEYLRGIDGLMPGAEHVDVPKSGNDSGNGQSLYHTLGLRYPDGSSQYDYLRRLAGRVQKINTEGHRVTAVGIFGSDAYDKLLILRALRGKIPDAVFFTTDLDARFFHADELKWTRGLVVGSSYGLELSPTLQQRTAPFRNTYQTGLYATMFTVLNGAPWAFNIDDYDPRIFEIGLQGAVDLSNRDTQIGEFFLPLHPEPDNIWRKHVGRIVLLLGLGLVVPALFLGVFGYFRSAGGNPGTMKPAFYWLLFAGACGGVVVLFFQTMAASGEDPYGGEPFTVFGGISIWPSLMIRILVFICSLYFIIRTYFSIRSDSHSVAAEFGFKTGCLKKTEFGFLENLLWPFRRNTAETDIARIWSAYSWRRGIGWIYVVLLAATIIYGGLAGAVVRCDQPFTPYRGTLALVAHQGSLRLALISMILLCGVTVYTLLRSTRLICNLYRRNKERYDPCCWHHSEMRALDCRVHLNNIYLVGRVTETTGRIIVYPFVVLFLMILSRYSLIDLWDWPLPLAGVVGLTVFAALFSAVYLRYKAKEIQKRAFDLLQLEKLKKPENSEEVDRCIEQIASCERGAFAPLSSNPILLAVLTPFGGIGAVSIIQSMVAGL